MNNTDSTTKLPTKSLNPAPDKQAAKVSAKTAPKSPATQVTKPTAKKAVKTVASAPIKPAKKAPAKAPVKTTLTKDTKAKAASPVVLPPQASPAKPAKADKTVKDKKVKVIRDSFSIPKAELAQINEMKKRAMAMGVSVKKSELIRAGLLALTHMSDAGFKKTLASVPTIKTGRPAKD